MEISLNRDTFLLALQSVIGVIERRHTIPILSNILLCVKNSQAVITATDLELQLQSEVKLDNIVSEGSITIPGRKMFDIVHTLPSGSTVHLKLDNNKIIIKSGRSRYVLSTLPAQNYPNSVIEESHLEFNIAQHTLLNILEKTHYAMAEQDVRYYLNGMCWEFEDNRLTTTTLDGHRLAITTWTFNTQYQFSPLKIIVPRKAIAELLRLLKKMDDSIDIKLSSQFIFIRNNNFSLISKLIEGKFPSTHALIKQKGENFFIVSNLIIQQVLNGVSILCNDKLPTIHIKLTPGLLKLKVHNAEQEQAEDEIEIDYQGEPITFFFNVKYLIRALQALEIDKDIKFSFQNADAPIFIESLDDAVSLHMIMPLRA